MSSVLQTAANPFMANIWKCEHCFLRGNSSTQLRNLPLYFKSAQEFALHLRKEHLSREGGSCVCRFGPTGICPNLPVEGVCDRDYEEHILRCHVYPKQAGNLRETVAPGVSNVVVPESAHTYSEIRRRQCQIGTTNGGISSNSSEGISNSNTHGLTITSVQPNVSSDSPWSIYHSVVNLPAVLNDPRHRLFDVFSSTWGDSFERAEVLPSFYLPKIDRRHFEEYTRNVLMPHKARMNATRNTQLESTSDKIGNIGNRALEQLQTHTELENIPKMFFDPNFQLVHTATFNAVLPWTCFTNRNDWSHLQESLTHNLDLVEMNIARQVSRKSSSFFQAVSSHDNIREHLGTTIQHAHNMRQKIRRLETENRLGPLKLLYLARQRESHALLYGKLKLMHTVHTAQPTIQTLLSACDFCGALDLIATTQDILQRELAGLQAFRHLASQLSEMARFVEKMVRAEFVSAIQTHLVDHRGSSKESDINELELETEEQLVPSLLGMLRIRQYNFAEVYHSEASQRLKDLVKQLLVKAVSAVEPAEMNTDALSLADQMRQLDYSAWLQLFGQVCAALARLLRRITTACRVMEAAVLRAIASDQDISLQEVSTVQLCQELRQLSTTLRETAQERAAKLLTARSKDGFIERLSASQFVELQGLADRLIKESCIVLPKDVEPSGASKTSKVTTCNFLTSAFHSQASRLVSRFHEERRNKLSLILDNEQWRAADVPAEFQRLAAYVQSSGRLRLPPPSSTEESCATISSSLSIAGERYVVVGTALLLFKMLVEYCAMSEDLSSSATDILSRLVELLKLFNSRTCQLLLGAGALQLVGLKTITTKNLCLASRCLQLILYFLPQVRRLFETLLNKQPPTGSTSGASFAPRQSASPLRHLDNITKDYHDHVSEISTKLLMIMEGRIETVVARWEVRPPVPSVQMREVARHQRKLHEAIAELWPVEQVRELLLRVHSAFKVQLQRRLSYLGLCNDNGPQHALICGDMSFYMESLKQLGGLEQLEDDFSELWSSSSARPS